MEHSKLSAGRYRKKPNSGVALILVLMLVVLTTVLILAFFLSVQTETRSVRSVISGQNSRQLADIAVQSVISQIQQATTQGPTVAWASQPGMIRCYNSANTGGGIGTTAGTGTALSWYKLYSATNMIVSNPTESLASIQNDVPTQGWATAGSANYGVYTDINSPVYSSDGNLTYPIANPSGATSIATAANTILGFDIATASTPGYTPGATAGSNASPTNNPAAMPVRWIYVLRDGTQVPAVATATPGTVQVTGASSSNPVVGRIAYWTDDETCKLNVNTAGNGTYFDTPRFGAVAIPPAANAYLVNSGPSPNLAGLTPAQRDAQRVVDQQLAMTPPIANEYQRYIGHPAQTRLSYAFPNSPSTALGAQDLGTLSQIFTAVSPFMQWGGSEAGLFTYRDTTPPLFPPLRQTPYATLDEWMFNTNLNTSSPATRVLNVDLQSPTPQPIVTNTSLQQLRFFLSTSSEAPEVNLFGQPRISIWPINNDFNWVTKPGSPYVTTTDKVIANASTLFPTSSSGTISAYPYYFTRKLATSSTYDYSNIARNQNIFQYLRTLASTAIPGYGGTFNGKYQTAEMDQILTEIFDYIRCTDPNDTLLLGDSPIAANNYAYTPAYARAVHGENGSIPYEFAGAGQVMPITITPSGAGYTTRGFGRFYSVSEISMDFTQSQPSTDTDVTPPAIATPTIIVTGVIYLNLYCPSLGPPDLIPNIRVEIDGLRDSTGTLTTTITTGTVTSTSRPVFGPLSDLPVESGDPAKKVYSVVNTTIGNVNTVSPYFGNSAYGWHDNPPVYDFVWGGSTGPRQLTINKGTSYADVGSSLSTAPMPTPVGQLANYMFCGIPMKIPKASTINFSGGTLKLIISQATDWSSNTKDPAYWSPGDGAPTASSSNIAQTITVNFPAFSVPAPTYAGTNDLSNRIYGSTYGPGAWADDNSPFKSGDAVRSLIAGYNGDMRLIAAQANLTSTNTGTTTPQVTLESTGQGGPWQPFVYFPPPTATTLTVHSQRDVFPNNSFTGHGFVSPGSLLSNVNYGTPSTGSPTANGFIGNHTTPGSTTTISPDGNGDFENGIGIFPDGPYINKPDEAQYQYATYGTNSPVPYYDGGDSDNSAALIYISPNRAVASPVVFGSLSTGVPLSGISPTPWRTLLFRPQPTHFGATSPEDELLLDWFWMPVAEPYAISTTLATAGKVNMNYQIAPFTYITRATALMGVLSSEYVIAVPIPASTATATTYKSATTAPTNPYRTPVRLLAGRGTSVTTSIDYSTGTLGQFNQRFNNGQIFKSAAEICDINLVPNPTPNAATGSFDPTSASAAATFWAANALAGDNSRERPYNGLYPRLTTKSNTFTVHVRAQALAWPINGKANTWVENPQLITSEYRGSTTINRYLDPQDPNIPDFTSSTSSSAFLQSSLDYYYKYRILETRRFLP